MNRVDKNNEITIKIITAASLLENKDEKFIADIESFSKELNGFYSQEEKKDRAITTAIRGTHRAIYISPNEEERDLLERGKAYLDQQNPNIIERTTKEINNLFEKMLDIIEQISILESLVKGINETTESYERIILEKKKELDENLSKAKEIFEEGKKSYSYGITEYTEINENKEESSTMLSRR